MVQASLVAQPVKNLPAMMETWVWSLGWEDSLEKGTATRSSILALPASESFPMSQLFAWGGQSTRVSALASFFPEKSKMRIVVKTSMEWISCHLSGGMWHHYHRLHGRAVWLGESRESGTALRLWKCDSSSDRSFPFIFIPFVVCIHSWAADFRTGINLSATTMPCTVPQKHTVVTQ